MVTGGPDLVTACQHTKQKCIRDDDCPTLEQGNTGAIRQRGGGSGVGSIEVSMQADIARFSGVHENATSC